MKNNYYNYLNFYHLMEYNDLEIHSEEETETTITPPNHQEDLKEEEEIVTYD